MPAERFKLGNKKGGRKKGSKNKLPPAELKLRVLHDRFSDYERIMKQAASSTFKTDRQWFASEYRKLLPKDEAVTITGDQQLVIAVPAPRHDEPAAKAPDAISKAG